jgi:septin 7
MFVWVCRNPLAQMEEEKRDHEAKMKKMESEMEQVFEMKVREKKQKLKDSEADVSIYIVDHCLPNRIFKKERNQ